MAFSESAKEYLQDRAGWLRVEKVQRDKGGYDIAIIIDGTYSPDVDGMVEYHADRLAEMLTHEGITNPRQH